MFSPKKIKRYQYFRGIGTVASSFNRVIQSILKNEKISASVHYMPDQFTIAIIKRYNCNVMFSAVNLVKVMLTDQQ